MEGLNFVPVTPGSLLITPVILSSGLYPGFYPGGSSYPGGGSNLPAVPVTPKTLTLVPA